MAFFSPQLKVGIVFILAVTVFLTGILWLKEFKPSHDSHAVRVIFDDANGIGKGDPVVLSGIKIGEVKKIQLTPENKALILLTTDTTVRLHSDASFTIRDIGLMGEKAIVVTPGSIDGPLDLSRPLAGTVTPGIDRVITSTDELVRNLTRLTERFDTELDIKRITDSMENTLAELRRMSGDVRAVTRETKKPLAEALSGVRSASDEMRRFVRTNESGVSQAVNGITDTSERLSSMVDSLSALSAVIDTLSTRLEKGEGTFAKFVRSGELYDELRHTNASIDSFVNDFRKNHGKYTKDMHLKLRLF